MAERIVKWSKKAQQERKAILAYWVKRNQSKTYSIKLKELFKEEELLIAKHPLIGTETNDPTVRKKVVRDYLLFYEFSETQITILTIWDGRKNPEELHIK